MKTPFKTVIICMFLTCTALVLKAQQKGPGKHQQTSVADPNAGKDDYVPYTPEDFKKSTYYKAQHGGFGFNQVPSKDPT
ncbi:MAG TPA: hypothetical protein VNZ86_13480, partial [Bacteroidia bacterium]|nr:hypothetical protein [Bacteroidia bacterium]